MGAKIRAGANASRPSGANIAKSLADPSLHFRVRKPHLITWDQGKRNELRGSICRQLDPQLVSLRDTKVLPHRLRESHAALVSNDN